MASAGVARCSASCSSTSRPAGDNCAGPSAVNVSIRLLSRALGSCKTAGAVGQRAGIAPAAAMTTSAALSSSARAGRWACRSLHRQPGSSRSASAAALSTGVGRNTQIKTPPAAASTRNQYPRMIRRRHFRGGALVDMAASSLLGHWYVQSRSAATTEERSAGALRAPACDLPRQR